MNKNYQPIVVDNATKMFKVLEEENFFSDFQIENREFVFEYFCDFFTEKFINGEYDNTNIDISNDEMERCLLDITIKDTLHTLTKEGIVDMIEDENNDEQFFLTDLGKNIVKKIN
jgi:hypothetical protein